MGKISILEVNKGSRALYLKLQVITALVVVVGHWVVVLLDVWKPPETPATQVLLYLGVPIVLISLYLINIKKIFSQRLGDAIQTSILVFLISVFGFYYGGGIGGDFVFLFLLLIAFSNLLLDFLIPLFAAGLISLVVIGEFILTTNFTQLSYIPLTKSILQVMSFLIIGWVSSGLVRRTLAEEKTSRELRKAARELRSAYRSIEALSQMKSEFLKVVNHQLRTPVSIIKGILSMMDEVMDRQKLKKYINKAYLSSERLSTILDDILLAQSLVGGKEGVKLASCQIEELLRKVVTHFQPMVKEKGLKIVFEQPKKELPMVLLDSSIIERIISRLIDNAILYTEKGDITVLLGVKKEKEKEFIQISVRDSGIGLTKEDKSSLFKLFHRGEEATSLHPNGSGLGLFIVKNLVETHKGKVKAQSPGRGKGTTFIITLPFITEV